MYAWVKKKEGNSKKDPRVKNRKSPKKEYNIKTLLSRLEIIGPEKAWI